MDPDLTLPFIKHERNPPPPVRAYCHPPSTTHKCHLYIMSTTGFIVDIFLYLLNYAQSPTLLRCYLPFFILCGSVASSMVQFSLIFFFFKRVYLAFDLFCKRLLFRVWSYCSLQVRCASGLNKRTYI